MWYGLFTAEMSEELCSYLEAQGSKHKSFNRQDGIAFSDLASKVVCDPSATFYC